MFFAVAEDYFLGILVDICFFISVMIKSFLFLLQVIFMYVYSCSVF
jgi:hypothetical protein